MRVKDDTSSFLLGFVWLVTVVVWGRSCLSLGEILFKPVSPYLAEVLKFLEGQNYTFLFFELSLLLM